MEEGGVAFSFLALGAVLVSWRSAQFLKKDGRTTTGHKDNVLPKTGKVNLLVSAGLLLLSTRVANFAA